MMLIGKRQWLRTVPRRLRLKMLVANIVGDICVVAAAVHFTLYRFPGTVLDIIVIILSCSAIFFALIYRKATKGE